MAAAGPWVIYNDFKADLCKKVHNLHTDTFYVALFTSTSTAINAAVVGATYTAFNADAHELPTANGYTVTGVSVGAQNTGIIGGGATATITFDCGDASWTANTSGFTARAAVLYNNTAAGKNAVAYMLLDSAPADVTTAAGNTLTINIVNVLTLA